MAVPLLHFGESSLNESSFSFNKGFHFRRYGGIITAKQLLYSFMAKRLASYEATGAMADYTISCVALMV